MWLDCYTQEQIAEKVGVASGTIANWILNFRKLAEYENPPESRQHFDEYRLAQVCGNRYSSMIGGFRKLADFANHPDKSNVLYTVSPWYIHNGIVQILRRYRRSDGKSSN
jgi:hypothetical protein